MHKYGFRVKNEKDYNYGERITLFKNKMVVDFFKGNPSGVRFRFKTGKAEGIYMDRNRNLGVDRFDLLPPQDSPLGESAKGCKYIGWFVPGEEYYGKHTMIALRNTPNGEPDESLVGKILKKGGFSR